MKIVRSARMAERTLIERVDVFDVYEGAGVPEGKKSLAIAVRLQPKDRTLTEAEIDAVTQKIVGAVCKATGRATLAAAGCLPVGCRCRLHQRLSECEAEEGRG